uniref:Uncharacterized protein n=1 Tax=Arundo donax TaxID=35708 RepID=A0A0A8YDU1_ARUDO
MSVVLPTIKNSRVFDDTTCSITVPQKITEK